MKVLRPVGSILRPNPDSPESQMTDRTGPGLAASTSRLVNFRARLCSTTVRTSQIGHHLVITGHHQEGQAEITPGNKMPPKGLHYKSLGRLWETSGNHRKRWFRPCQGWGRGFESHRPLQFLQKLRSRSERPSRERVRVLSA